MLALTHCPSIVQSAVITGSTTSLLLPQPLAAQNGVRSSSRKRKLDGTLPISEEVHKSIEKPLDKAERTSPGGVEKASGDAGTRHMEDEGPISAADQSAGRSRAHGGERGKLGVLRSNATAKKKQDVAGRGEGDGNVQTDGDGVSVRTRRAGGVASGRKGAGSAARLGTGIREHHALDSGNVSTDHQERIVAGSGDAINGSAEKARGQDLRYADAGNGGADDDEGGRGGEQVAPSVVRLPLFSQVYYGVLRCLMWSETGRMGCPMFFHLPTVQSGVDVLIGMQVLPLHLRKYEAAWRFVLMVRGTE